MSVTLQPAELDAETAFDIAGQVLAGGGRVEGATVTLWAATAAAPVQLGRAATGADGRFTISSAAASAKDASLYLIAEGGKSSADRTDGDNDSMVLMTVLGGTPPANVVINELTTIASVWTHAQFVDGAAIKGHALGLRIAAGNVPNLADITTGGNAFIAGGYNSTISSSFGSPIAGRQAWSGTSSGYIDSTINMPAAANGQNVQLKWRMASDNSVAVTGVRIDNIVISNTTFVCNTACAGAPRISVSSTLSCSGSNKVATITLCNSGTATANSVVLTTAALGGVSGTPLPQSLGNLAPGASATTTVTFTGAPSGSTTLQVGGTYTGGSFNSSRKVTAPVCGTASLSPAAPIMSLPARLAVAVLPTVLTGR